MTDIRDEGLKIFGELLGDRAAEAIATAISSDNFGAPIAALAADFAYGSVWTREGLDRKQRSLVTIGMLVALRQAAELRNHVRIGITNGLTARELEEVLVQAIPYVGFPAVAVATTAVIEVLRELGLDTETPTSEEQGLL